MLRFDKDMPRVLPVALSLLVHIGGVALAAVYLRATSPAPDNAQPVTLEFVPLSVPYLVPHASPIAVASQAAGAVRRPVPRRPLLHPAAPMKVDPAPVSETPLLPPGDAPPDLPALPQTKNPTPRFVLDKMDSKNSGANGGGLVKAGTSNRGDVVSEDAVTVPARLLSDAPVAYPPRARAAEVETDVAMELVVDEFGRVRQARVLNRSGYGLDEAALKAIWLYRFSPAWRGGRPVAVQLRWFVHFRLR